MPPSWFSRDEALLKVSRICLGCMTYGAPATGELKGGSHAWALNEEESQPYLRQALDLGINFFDTANVYSTGASEEVLGNFLKTNARREAVVVATGFPVRRSRLPGCLANRHDITDRWRYEVATP